MVKIFTELEWEGYGINLETELLKKQNSGKMPSFLALILMCYLRELVGSTCSNISQTSNWSEDYKVLKLKLKVNYYLKPELNLRNSFEDFARIDPKIYQRFRNVLLFYAKLKAVIFLTLSIYNLYCWEELKKLFNLYLKKMNFRQFVWIDN